MPRASTSSLKAPERGRKKQTTSCDGCRLRKAKCHRVDDPGIARGIASIPCDGCQKASIQCTYLRGSKKRGRASIVLDRLRSDQEQRVRAQSSSSPVSPHSRATLAQPESLPESHYQPTTSAEEDILGLGDLSWMVNPVTPISPANTVFASGAVEQLSPINQISSGSGSKRNEAIHVLAAHTWAASPRPLGLRRLEDCLPRSTALSILELYFDIVYCVIPLVHQPSFMMNFRASHDHGNRKFLALVLAIIATTLIHVPKLHFTGHDLDGLSRSCLRESERIVMDEMASPDIDVVSTRYLNLVVHEKLGNRGYTMCAFGDAQSLAIELGYHWESTYRDLDPVEAERRRRVWYLLYNADKCASVLGERPVLLRSDEFTAPGSVVLPRELQDECITPLGYLFPEGGVPLISGFNIVTRIMTILGDVLILNRSRWKLSSSGGDAAQRALDEVQLLDQRLRAVAGSIPDPFVLRGETGQLQQAVGWQETVRADLRQYLQNPANPTSPVNGYTVLKANIYVTLAMTQLQLILYRESVQQLIRKIIDPVGNALMAETPEEQQNWRSSAYSSLYRAIHEIPVQALAANGPSILGKIRVVAVTLLDNVPAEGTMPGMNDTASYLFDFLNIMTSIEDQYVPVGKDS